MKRNRQEPRFHVTEQIIIDSVSTPITKSYTSTEYVREVDTGALRITTLPLNRKAFRIAMKKMKLAYGSKAKGSKIQKEGIKWELK